MRVPDKDDKLERGALTVERITSWGWPESSYWMSRPPKSTIFSEVLRTRGKGMPEE
jgi:hypothetical protein